MQLLQPAASKGEAKEKKVIVASARLDDLIDTMDAVDCNEDVARRVLEWYGEESSLKKEMWNMKIEDLVKEIGICVLADGGVDPIYIHLILSGIPTDKSDLGSTRNNHSKRSSPNGSITASHSHHSVFYHY